jgi:predicted choloylglycine hydrolase
MTVKIYRFTGNHYEVGLQQGKAMRESIQAGLDAILASEFMKSSKPKLIPMSVYYPMAKRRANKMLRTDILKYYPKQAQRIQGIADGASVDLPTILFTQMLEVLVGCTTMAFSPDRTSTSETIMAKNFDYLTFLAPYNFVCETKLTDGYRTLGFKMASLPGMYDGMNEHGLTITYNLARSTDKPEFFVPTGIVLQEMLETCKSVDEGVRMIVRSKRGGHDGLITLADSSGEIRTVELSCHNSVVRETANGQVINTNNYQTAEMQVREIPLDSGDLPGFQSSLRRIERAKEILKDKPLVDEEAICSVLRDHGREGVPSAYTICKHGEPGCTHRSMIFHPDRKTIKMLFGNPCLQREYQEIGFV